MYWDQPIRLARSKPAPFNIMKLQHEDFLNFNTEQDQFLPEKINKREMTNPNEKNIKFTDCVWFQYRKSEINKIFVKTDYSQNDFQVLIRKRKRGLKKFLPNDTLPPPITPYPDRICISEVKKRDLLQLCNQGLIPRAYKNYYEQLPTDQSALDFLAEPDHTEIE